MLITYHRLSQTTAPFDDINNIVYNAIFQAHNHIKIAEAYITVNANNLGPIGSKRDSQVGYSSSLSDATFSRSYCDYLCGHEFILRANLVLIVLYDLARLPNHCLQFSITVNSYNFRLRILLRIQSCSYFLRDAQLGWGKIERTYDRLRIPFRSGMHHAAQATPDEHAPFSNDLCTRVDVPEDKDMTRKFYPGSGTERTVEE